MPDAPSIQSGRSTFAKVAVLVSAGGVIACALLALRQARLQALHETAASQLRLQSHEERVFQIRAQIGREILPERVRRMAADLGDIRPLRGSPLPGAGQMTVAEGGTPDRDQPGGRP